MITFTITDNTKFVSVWDILKDQKAKTTLLENSKWVSSSVFWTTMQIEPVWESTCEAFLSRSRIDWTDVNLKWFTIDSNWRTFMTDNLKEIYVKWEVWAEFIIWSLSTITVK